MSKDKCNICELEIDCKQYIRVGGYKVHSECGETAIGNFIESKEGKKFKKEMENS
jgi:hypothetical protein